MPGAESFATLRPRDPTVVTFLEGSLMRSIIQANINRFKILLETEPDPTKRAMEERLLAEEEAKLTNWPVPEKKQA
jgi:hypothetical protein